MNFLRSRWGTSTTIASNYHGHGHGPRTRYFRIRRRNGIYERWSGFSTSVRRCEGSGDGSGGKKISYRYFIPPENGNKPASSWTQSSIRSNEGEDKPHIPRTRFVIGKNSREEEKERRLIDSSGVLNDHSKGLVRPVVHYKTQDSFVFFPWKPSRPEDAEIKSSRQELGSAAFEAVKKVEPKSKLVPPILQSSQTHIKTPSRPSPPQEKVKITIGDLLATIFDTSKKIERKPQKPKTTTSEAVHWSNISRYTKAYPAPVMIRGLMITDSQRADVSRRSRHEKLLEGIAEYNKTFMAQNLAQKPGPSDKNLLRTWSMEKYFYILMLSNVGTTLIESDIRRIFRAHDSALEAWRDPELEILRIVPSRNGIYHQIPKYYIYFKTNRALQHHYSNFLARHKPEKYLQNPRITLPPPPYSHELYKSKDETNNVEETSSSTNELLNNDTDKETKIIPYSAFASIVRHPSGGLPKYAMTPNILYESNGSPGRTVQIRIAANSHWRYLQVLLRYEILEKNGFGRYMVDGGDSMGFGIERITTHRMFGKLSGGQRLGGAWFVRFRDGGESEAERMVREWDGRWVECKGNWGRCDVEVMW